jgi:TPR repeat protein
VFQLALAAERDAAAGDAAAQWLRGSLYLFGFGVPRDRATGMRWMETATRTALPVIRAAMPNPPSEVELFSMMLSTAEASLPEMVQRDGVAQGITAFKQSARTVLQVLSGCLDHPSTQR